MTPLGYFTARDLAHDRGRSILAIAGLSVVVVGYLLLAALSRAYLTFGNEPQVTDNLMILSAEALDPMESSLSEEVLEIAEQIAPTEILATFPAIFRHLRIGEHVMQVRAAPPAHMQGSLALTLLSGAWPDDQDQIVISEGVLQIAPWQVGSQVTIYGTEFTVSGIVRAGGNKFASIWMTYSSGRRLFASRQDFQMGYLKLAPSADAERVRLKLESDPRLEGRYVVYLESTVSDRLGAITRDLATLSMVQALAALLAISFGSYAASSLSLAERQREILLLRLLGFSQASLRLFLLVRTLILTLLAYGLGWVVARIFTAIQQVQAPISLHAAPLNLDLDLGASLLGLVLTCAFAALGVWLTTARLSSMSLSRRSS